MQVYETPVPEIPVAPAGEQNAPGVTIDTGVGVGEGAGIGTGAVAKISNLGDCFKNSPFEFPLDLNVIEILNVKVGVSKQEINSWLWKIVKYSSVFCPDGRYIPLANLLFTIFSSYGPVKHFIIILPGIIKFELEATEIPD